MSDGIEPMARVGATAGEVAGKLFPGIAERSKDNATSSSIHAVMSDIEDILA